MSWLYQHWQRHTPLSLALIPVSWIYCLLVALRRSLYRRGVKTSVRLPVPVIVVGNITAGGTGKTPLALWLVRYLRQQGYRPGIVARGYGGRSATWPLRVRQDSEPAQVGDEPLLLARNGSCPVAVGPDRAHAAQILVRGDNCDVIVSDDGLQHYGMARDIEIALIDGERRFGNGQYLPAGPLREPVQRLQRVSACVTNGEPRKGEFGMELEPLCFRRVTAPTVERPVHAFAGQRVHAVTGIGHPQRFFDQLRKLGIDVMERPFPDHHRFRARDIQFTDKATVIMTEKDAVKCEQFVDDRYWYLAIAAKPNPALGTLVLTLLKEQARESLVVIRQ